MSDFNVSKGPREDGGFFAKNGTLQGISSALDSVNALSSNSATGRIGGLSQLFALIMSLFA